MNRMMVAMTEEHDLSSERALARVRLPPPCQAFAKMMTVLEPECRAFETPRPVREVRR